jgi:hypothetical protein
MSGLILTTILLFRKPLSITTVYWKKLEIRSKWVNFAT